MSRQSHWAVALAIGLAFARADVVAAKPPTPAPAPTRLEVEMDPTVPDAQVLAEWVHDESIDALAELGPALHRRGTIRVSISGDLYDYQVSVSTLPECSPREAAVSWPCACTNDELLARIRTEVQAAASTLDGSTTQAGALAGPPVTRARAPLQALSLRNKLGLGLLAGGAAATSVGITLLAVGDHRDGGDPNYRVPGVPTLLVGLGLVAAGTTVIVLEHRPLRQRRALARAAMVPFVTHRGVHVGVTARF